MPHKHCVRLFRLMNKHMRKGGGGGPLISPVVSWGLLATIIVISILSFINDSILIIDCLCNIINCVANKHSYIQETLVD